MAGAYYAPAIFSLNIIPAFIFESNLSYFAIIPTNKGNVNTDNNVPATTIRVA